VQVQVVFTGTGDIRKSTLTEIHNQIVNKERLSKLILIVQSKMTAYARKELENCQYKVEIIKVSYPFYNCFILIIVMQKIINID
jgi:DNA-directed RNA polymerase I, II, and III subunit RPABC1